MVITSSLMVLTYGPYMVPDGPRWSHIDSTSLRVMPILFSFLAFTMLNTVTIGDHVKTTRDHVWERGGGWGVRYNLIILVSLFHIRVPAVKDRSSNCS